MKYVRKFGPVTDYGPDYYSHYYGRQGPITYSRENPAWLQFFGYVADEIVRQLGPRTALDVGCAKGFLVECLRDRGVVACGFDVSEYAISEVRPDMRPYYWVGSAASAIDKDYDLITCLEVCEHLPEPEAHEAVRQMTSHTDTILFSSTPSDFTEPTHVNVHPIVDWLRLFGQFRSRPIAPLMRDSSLPGQCCSAGRKCVLLIRSSASLQTPEIRPLPGRRYNKNWKKRMHSFTAIVRLSVRSIATSVFG